jgi:hypothetical protein
MNGKPRQEDVNRYWRRLVEGKSEKGGKVLLDEYTPNWKKVLTFESEPPQRALEHLIHAGFRRVPGELIWELEYRPDWPPHIKNLPHHTVDWRMEQAIECWKEAYLKADNDIRGR